MTTQATTQKAQTPTNRRSALLLGLGVGVALAGAVALAGVAQRADAAAPEKIVFVSERTTGKGVSNPTGDAEIFRMNPNGTGVRQLTFNTAEEGFPVLSPDGTRIAYRSNGIQDSNPEGDQEVYVMNASDGSGQKNLTDNGAAFDEQDAQFSPDGRKIAYTSDGEQASNPEADQDVYVMGSDGSNQKNLSNNGTDVHDVSPSFSPDGTKVAYTSYGEQPSNPEGDVEIFVMNASDGSGQKNLSNNALVADQNPYFSANGQKIAYSSLGKQASNPEGDYEVYLMNASDGSGQKNLTNTGGGVNDYGPDFSPDGTRIVYTSYGIQTSNSEGDYEIYVMNSLDGSGKKNLSNSGPSVSEFIPEFSPDGTKIVYTSYGVETSNPEGDYEVYHMNALDGLGKKNLTNNDALDFYAEWGRQAI
jgi:Tol biopolymer transport system component